MDRALVPLSWILLALLSVMGWLHLQADDEIFTAPRTTVPEFQVARRREESLSIPIS